MKRNRYWMKVVEEIDHYRPIFVRVVGEMNYLMVVEVKMSYRILMVVVVTNHPLTAMVMVAAVLKMNYFLNCFLIQVMLVVVVILNLFPAKAGMMKMNYCLAEH